MSSEAHRFSKFDVEDLNNEKGVNSLNVYGNSKLANILFTLELADRLKGSGMDIYKYIISLLQFSDTFDF